MQIEVWSVGKTTFTAGPEFQEPMIRESIDQRGDVASVITGYTDSERSDIRYDEYARVTGDVPGLVLFEGWLTGNRDAPPPAGVARPAPGGGRSESVIEAMARAAYEARMRAVGLVPRPDDIELHAEIAGALACCEIDSEMARVLRPETAPAPASDATIDADQFAALCNLFCLVQCDGADNLTAEQIGDVLYFRASPMVCDQSRLMARAVAAFLGLRNGDPGADELISEVHAAMRNGKGSLPDGDVTP